MSRHLKSPVATSLIDAKSMAALPSMAVSIKRVSFLRGCPDNKSPTTWGIFRATQTFEPPRDFARERPSTSPAQLYAHSGAQGRAYICKLQNMHTHTHTHHVCDAHLSVELSVKLAMALPPKEGPESLRKGPFADWSLSKDIFLVFMSLVGGLVQATLSLRLQVLRGPSWTPKVSKMAQNLKNEPEELSLGYLYQPEPTFL